MQANAEQGSPGSRAAFLKVAALVLFAHLAVIFALLLAYSQPSSRPTAETLIRLSAMPLVGQIANEVTPPVSRQVVPPVPANQPNPAPVIAQSARSVATPSITISAPAPATEAIADVNEAQRAAAGHSTSVSGQARSNVSSEPDFKAAYLNNPKPPYPRMAVRQQIEGTVMLLVRVLPNGLAGDVRVDQSSGNQLLDDSALRTVRNWRFVPAQKEGVAVSAEVRVPIVFSLN
jgi:periplasmic protein TonB